MNFEKMQSYVDIIKNECYITNRTKKSSEVIEKLCFMADMITPQVNSTPLKKSLFYTKWYKIKYTYVFCATIYCM